MHVGPFVDCLFEMAKRITHTHTPVRTHALTMNAESGVRSRWRRRREKIKSKQTREEKWNALCDVRVGVTLEYLFHLCTRVLVHDPVQSNSKESDMMHK